jgi:type IV pilus assembly protein PilE
MTTAFPGYPINARGWTMLELVIALLILAILVALAIPAYNNQIIKARRADGHALLFEAAQREQQFFTANNTYTSTIGSGGLDMSATSQEGYTRCRSLPRPRPIR